MYSAHWDSTADVSKVLWVTQAIHFVNGRWTPVLVGGSSVAGVLDVAALMQMALQLTAEQKERLLAARTYLLAQMMEIIQERTLIIAMLQV